MSASDHPPDHPPSSRLADLERIAAKSKKPLPWYGLAMEYKSAGQMQRAVETFEKVHAIDANYVAAYFMCAQARAEMGDTDGARSELDKGITVARAIGDAHAESEMVAMRESL
jgi:Tfp pilus assembly protein PilF